MSELVSGDTWCDVVRLGASGRKVPVGWSVPAPVRCESKGSSSDNDGAEQRETVIRAVTQQESAVTVKSCHVLLVSF